jgi:hypothetical protein
MSGQIQSREVGFVKEGIGLPPSWAQVLRLCHLVSSHLWSYRSSSITRVAMQNAPSIVRFRDKDRVADCAKSFGKANLVLFT